MGHASLKFSRPGAPIAESGVAFVLPEYRRLGLFGQFNQVFIEHAVSTGMFGLYGRAVTSHTASQRMAAAHGYNDCGLFLGVFPGDVDFKKIAGITQQRESGVLSFLALKSNEPRSLYLPSTYHGLIGRLFDSLGLPVLINTDALVDDYSQDQSFWLETTINQSLNLAEIAVHKYGHGDELEFRRLFKELCHNRIDVVHAIMDLEDPRTVKMVKEAEKMGFIFAGILPYGLGDHHALLLQYLNNIEMDIRRIKLFSSEANSILDFMAKVL